MTPLLIIVIPLGAFLVICVPLALWLERDPAPRPVRVPGPVPVPAPFPSSAIPDRPVLAGRVADGAWLDFVTVHGLRRET